MQTRSSLFNLHSAATIKSIEQNDGPYDTLETPMREATHLSMNSSFSVPSSQWPHTDGTLSNGSSLTASESTFSSTQTNTDKLMKRLSVLHHVIDLLLACALLYAGLARITIPSLIYFFGFFLGFMNPFGLKSHTLLLPKCIAAFGWTVLIMDGVLIILRSSSKLRDSVVQHMIWVHSRPSWMELYGIDLFVTMYATFYCVVAYPWLNARARVYSYRAFGRIIEVTEEQKIRRESQSVLLPLYCHLSYHIEVTASRGVDENTVRAPGMSIRWLEIWIAQLLLISSTSVPTLSTGIYYLILLERFLQWTYYAKSLTIEQLQKTDSRRILLGTRRFVGDKTAMVVLIVAHLWLHLLYIYQSPLLQDERVIRIGYTLGFRKLQHAKYINSDYTTTTTIPVWTYYISVSCQLLLVLLCAQLCRAYRLRQFSQSRGIQILVSRHSATYTRDQKENEIADICDRRTLHSVMPLVSPNARFDAPHPSTATFDLNLEHILSDQPRFVRMFIAEGGLLMSSLAAIIWSVSYPSYASAPLLAWAFLIIGFYGISVPSFTVAILFLYGTCLGIMEYGSNLMANSFAIESKTYWSKYGLRVFDLPLIDLYFHNICLGFMFYAIRTQLRFANVVRVLKNHKRQKHLQRKRAVVLRSDGFSVQSSSAVSCSSVSLYEADEDIVDRREVALAAQYEHEAAVQARLHRNWTHYAKLWLSDAKQILLLHMDILVLLTLVIVILSTNVSIVQVGYLILAAALILFFEDRRRLWRILLWYSLVTCFLVFVRNIECTGRSRQWEVIGLVCFHKRTDSLKVWTFSLWPTLFTTQLLIISQVVFQLVVYVSKKQLVDPRFLNTNVARQRPLVFLSRFVVELKHAFRITGAAICYFVFFTVCLCSETIVSENGTISTSVLGCIQFCAMILLVGVHIGNYVKAPRTSNYLRVAWSMTLVLETLILACRYLYQFDAIATFLDSSIFTSSYFTAQHFGLKFHVSLAANFFTKRVSITSLAQDTISHIFIYLLPTAILVFLCFWQLISLSQCIEVPSPLAQLSYKMRQSKCMKYIHFCIKFFRAFLIVSSSAIMSCVAMVIALEHINAIGGTYIVIIVGVRPFVRSWKSLWIPLFWFSSLVIMTKYIYQLGIFNGQHSHHVDIISSTWQNGEKNLALLPWLTRLRRWIGIPWLPEEHFLEGKKMTFQHLLFPQIWIMLFCFMARITEYWRLQTIQTIRHQQACSSVQPHDNEGYNTHTGSHSVIQNEETAEALSISKAHRNDKALPTVLQSVRECEGDSPFEDQRFAAIDLTREKSFYPDLLASNDEEFMLMSVLQKWILETAAFDVLGALMAISAFLHCDVSSIIYICLVFRLMRAQKPSFKRCEGQCIIIFVSLVIGIEYGSLLILSPLSPIPMAFKSNHIWSQYLLFKLEMKWALLVDFFILIQLYLLVEANSGQNITCNWFSSCFLLCRSNAGIKQAKASVLQRENTNIPKSNLCTETNKYEDPSLLKAPSRNITWQGIASGQFLCNVRSNMRAYLLLWLISTWLPITLVTAFIININNCGFVSAFYGVTAVYMLYHIDHARMISTLWLWQLRYCNWLHLFLLLVADFPLLRYIFNHNGAHCVYGSTEANTCVNMANLTGIYSQSFPYGPLVVFIMLAVQGQLMKMSEYKEFSSSLQNQNGSEAAKRRDLLYFHQHREKVRQWFYLKSEKKTAIQRLKLTVNKSVHKMEELLDIAMGLNYSLPPMAPEEVQVVTNLTTHTSISIYWKPPTNSVHTIRSYRIYYQRFPSTTILGDYSLYSEVQGSDTQGKIDGLRPGASYQFKVTAVSRMGEGPMSVATTPSSTLAFRLDDNCTAGWMKYRREPVAGARFRSLFRYFRAVYLNRYVVIDEHQLVIYRNEEAALRHRTRVAAEERKRKTQPRKKKPTKRPLRRQCILWRDVLSFELSAKQIRFDDVSPRLYCFILYVRSAHTLQHSPQDQVAHEFYRDHSISEVHTVTKFTLQAESSRGFKKFLSAMAFAVPKGVVGQSVLKTLRKIGLPDPTAVSTTSKLDACEKELLNVFPCGNAHRRGTRTSVGDEAVSEYSSEQGESTFNDSEGLNYDNYDTGFQSWLLTCRLPVYIWLHRHQDAIGKADTPAYELDDPCDPTVLELLGVIINNLKCRSELVCFVVIIVCFSAQADFFNFLIVIFTFCYVVFEHPNASAFCWRALLLYTCVILLLRYMFQLTIFCQYVNDQGMYIPSISPRCSSPSLTQLSRVKAIQPMVLIGIYKMDGGLLRDTKTIFSGLKWNLYVVLSLCWHIYELKRRGLWMTASAPETHVDDQTHTITAQEAEIMESLQHLYSIVDSPISVKDSLIGNGSDHNASKPIQQTLLKKTSSIQFDSYSFKAIDTNANDSNLRDSNYNASEIDCVKLQKEGDDLLFDSGDQSGQKVAHSIDENTRNLKHMHASQPFPKCITKCSSVYAYFETLLTQPPPHWDRCNDTTMQMYKPGRDYYTPSLVVSLLSYGYALIFFNALGEPDRDNRGGSNWASTSTSINLSPGIETSGIFSGNLVLLVIMQLILAIWDRIAYLCRSILYKLILQYVYAAILLISIWLLVPYHTEIYFQERIFLVILYLIHMTYLWFGGLQIRYGYRVYRGLRYKSSDEDTFSWKCLEIFFPIYRLAPFLFELRALLDYLCTRTSLTWYHWITLEDAAAHFFCVKLEMNDRSKNTKILNGLHRQPLSRKLFSAGIMLLFLYICLITPLAVFSSLNPNTKSNAVKLATVSFGIGDKKGISFVLYRNRQLRSPRYADKNISYTTSTGDIQKVSVYTFSESLWDASPPQIDSLTRLLNQSQEHKRLPLCFGITFEFLRSGPDDFETTKITYTVPMMPKQRQLLMQVMMADSSNVSNTSIKIPTLYPPVLQLTAIKGIRRRTLAMQNVRLRRNIRGTHSWWSLEPEGVKSQTPLDPIGCGADAKKDTLCLITVSDLIVKGLRKWGFDFYGLTALYFFVLITIGDTVKTFFRGRLYNVQYTEIPEPDHILELIQGIYLVREENYVGHLKDEVRIFETLIRLLRSPETLLHVTGTNVIHLRPMRGIDKDKSE